ncbi:MAG: GvpL/GvpF family gas vesicle protein [Bacteroidota bacterium]
MLYLYAFCRPPLPPDVPGLHKTMLRAIPVGALVAAVSDLDTPPSAGAPHLWAHEHAVETLMQTRPVLPVRFGTMLHDAEHLQAVTAPQEAAMHEALARVDGHVELSVRALAAEPPLPPAEAPPRTGTDYLRQRQAQLSAEQADHQQAQQRAAALHAQLAPLAADSTYEARRTARMVLTGAYLVPADQQDAFQDAVAALQTQHPDLAFLCTGPWPPYHFTRLALTTPTP